MSGITNPRYTMLKMLLAVVLATIAGSTFACCNSELKEPAEAVKVIDPSFTVTRTDGPVLVSVFGSLRNTTEHTVGDLVVEARLTDSTGKLIDVLTQPVYGVVVPAGQQVAFRMQSAAAAKESSYVAVQARVSSGETQRPRAAREEQKAESPVMAFLMSWGPMLLLILVWVVLARKYSGKGSLQHRSLDLIAEQNAILSRQLVAVEAMAAAAARRSGKTGDTEA